jgi:hypothetical protein
MAMEQDIPALKKIMPGGKPHPVDRVLHDGDEVKLGGSVLTAHLTAGHTKGCTSWSMKATEAGKSYDVVIVGSVGWNPGYVLVNNKDYPQIADDYVRSFATLRKLPCDVFLAAHIAFYDLESKYPKLDKGGPNPFIDHAGYLAYIDLKEKQFQTSSSGRRRAASHERDPARSAGDDRGDGSTGTGHRTGGLSERGGNRVLNGPGGHNHSTHRYSGCVGRGSTRHYRTPARGQPATRGAFPRRNESLRRRCAIPLRDAVPQAKCGAEDRVVEVA